MLDEDFRLQLIEVNTNPCLETESPLLARIIPELIENTFKLVLDPLFPSPDVVASRKQQINELPQEIKYCLIFDDEIEGPELKVKFEEYYSKMGVEGAAKNEIESDVEDELVEEEVADEEEEEDSADNDNNL